MKPASRSAFILAALLFHAVLIAAGIAAFSSKTASAPPKPLPVTVELLPPSVAPPAQETPPVPPAPPPPPEVAPAPPKPVVKPVPKPTPKKKATIQEPPPVRQTEVPPVPSPSPPPSAPDPAPQTATAPVQQAPVPIPAPAPPARTGVSISASYAASNRKPPYPALSRRYEEQGTVVLRVQVRADGTAGAVEIKSSSGHPLLDESAKSTVQTWRFNPATSDGKPITEWYELSIPFKLEN